MVSDNIYQLNVDNDFSKVTDHISNEFYAYEFLLEQKIKEEKMESEDLKRLLIYLNNIKINNISQVKEFYKKLEKAKKEMLTYEQLEDLAKIATDLETKYNEFVELSNYFDPFYIRVKKGIHSKEVNKLREDYRKKRGEC